MRYHLILGNQAYSSWSLRGWLLFEAFGIDFDYEVVPLFTEAYEAFVRERFPARTVPALEIADGAAKFTMWDSLAIAETLHENHPEAGIWPADARARAIARSLAAEMHSGFGTLRDAMPMNVRRQYRSFEPTAETQRDIARIETLWEWTQTQWGGSGPYLFGDRFHAVDAFFAPVASRFRTYDIELIPEARAYADALLAHPATQAFYRAGEAETWTLPEYELNIE